MRLRLYDEGKGRLSTFTVPNHPVNVVNAATFVRQSQPDKVDFDILAGGHAQNGVISGCVVSAAGGLDLAVSAGTIIVGGTQTALGGATITASTGHPTLPRTDLVIATAAGFAIIVGTPHAHAPMPNYALATQVVLAAVLIPAADNVIDATQLTPKRIVVLPWAGGGGGGAPTTADYLVGTINGALPNAIVAGTSPGGELGGTWASPTVDAVHAGSAHHTAAHALQSADHSGGISTTQHGALAGPASAHRWGDLDKTISALADITTRPHSSLTSIGADDHHAQSHSHASHTSIGADDHHAQSHTHASHASIGIDDHHARDHAIGGATHTGTLAHSALGSVGANDHHNQAHVLASSDHTASGLTIGHVLRASGAAAFAWAQLQHSDLGSVSADQHHAESHTLASHTGTLDHGALTGLTDDDHTQYPQAASTETISGLWTFNEGAVLPSLAAPGSPAEGRHWNDSTQKALAGFVDGVTGFYGRTLYVSTASVTISGSNTAETTLIGSGVGTLTLPAAFLVPGKTLRLTAWGYSTWDPATDSGAGMTLRARLGGTFVCGTANFGVVQTFTNLLWRADILLVCRQTGSSATVFGQGMVSLDALETSAGGLSVALFAPMARVAAANVNTANALAVDFTADWIGTSAAESITCTHFILEELH